MIFKPTREDLKVIGQGIGRVILGVGLIMLIPLVVAVVSTEWLAVIDFLIGIFACVAFWLVTEMTCKTNRDLTWFHGLIVASAGWLTAMFFGAIPHMLSGHFKSYLDACFDLMSGYTTTGLFLLQDLDHVSHGLNMWRHLLTYAGGQGIIVIALTFLFAGTAGAFKIYASEGKEEKLLPNVIRTARAIWMISLTYLVVGSVFLFVALLFEGMPAGRGFLHSVWLFMGAWSTGGFAPQSLNLLYYHSLWIEIVTLVIFVIGSFNFVLHYSVWTRRRTEILKNIEIRSFAITTAVTSFVLAIGLSKGGVYTTISEFLRKGVYNLISGHTTTGNATVYSNSFVGEFGFIAMWGIIIAMAIGASAASTGGGFKGLRVGILTKSLWGDIKGLVSPESAVVREKVHHVRDIWLDEALVKGTMLILLSYVIIYFIGGILGLMYGYEPSVAFFDAVSAGSNTGLSTGLTSPLMPALLKVWYIFVMWAGRLEFLSIFALFGMAVAVVKGKRVGRR
ncbi:MAG: TrkH family potassium uptake protein [Actinobacteria bacterium]|nr:TrkH family potassium uptake protein [Actinomycetota bacterium]MBU1945188.1 TrkH family potassium uptake protein [Actinomycetota bacterium]MBU2687726.1 TrkH family potassium uptake protein [Actinomycetota bacterium]